jgi:hypothetical protein
MVFADLWAVSGVLDQRSWEYRNDQRSFLHDAILAGDVGRIPGDVSRP